MSEIFPEPPVTSLPEAVAFMGALPVPVGPQPQPQSLSVERERMIRIWHEELARLSGSTAVARREALGELLDEIDLLRVQVAELNESVETAAEALRARQSCPCPPENPPAPHQVGCFFDGVPVSPPSERPVNGLTAKFMPVAARRELSSREEPHDSPIHHDYRLSHDLPDGCRLTAEQAERLGNPYLGGGAS